MLNINFFTKSICCFILWICVVTVTKLTHKKEMLLLNVHILFCDLEIKDSNIFEQEFDINNWA